MKDVECASRGMILYDCPYVIFSLLWSSCPFVGGGIRSVDKTSHEKNYAIRDGK